MKNVTSNEEKVKRIVNAGGPTAQEQRNAIVNNAYWHVCGIEKVAKKTKNNKVLIKAQAVKHALQAFGPYSDRIPGLRTSTGSNAFHTHVIEKTTYIIEWSVIDKATKKIAITGFGSHENYQFKKNPSQDKCNSLTQKYAAFFSQSQQHIENIKKNKAPLQNHHASHQTTSRTMPKHS